jgi:hypothetical protein
MTPRSPARGESCGPKSFDAYLTAARPGSVQYSGEVCTTATLTR